MRTLRWVLLVLFWPVAMAAVPLVAADNGQATLVVAADSYVDANAATTNFNARPLHFAAGSTYDASTALYCPALTRLTYLQFDLAAVAFPVDKAELVLTATECATNGAALQLFSADNNWREDELTWNNRPAMQFLLPETSIFEPAGRLVWTDAGQTALPGLADYLAMQQAAGVTTVTLGIIMPLPTGCTPAAPAPFSLLFHDREQSSAIVDPCVGQPEPPLLLLADAASALPERGLGPTAVRLAGQQTEMAPSGLLVWLLFAALLLLSLRVGLRPNN